MIYKLDELERMVNSDLNELSNYRHLCTPPSFLTILALFGSLLPLLSLKETEGFLVTWIPGGFAFFIIWLFWAISKVIKTTNIKKIISAKNKTDWDIEYIVNISMKTVRPFINAIVIILLLNVAISIYLIIKMGLLCASVPAIFYMIIAYLLTARLKTYEALSKELLKKKKIKPKVKIGWAHMGYLIFLIFLFIISLVVSFFLIKNFLFLLFTIFFNFIAMISIANILINCQTEKIVEDQIIKLSALKESVKYIKLKNKKINNKQLEELVKKYLHITRYKVRIERLFGIFKFYFIAPSFLYLELSKHNEKTLYFR